MIEQKVRVERKEGLEEVGEPATRPKELTIGFLVESSVAENDETLARPPLGRLNSLATELPSSLTVAASTLRLLNESVRPSQERIDGMDPN